MDKQIWITAGKWDCGAPTAALMGVVPLLKASATQNTILPKSLRGKP